MPSADVPSRAQVIGQLQVAAGRTLDLSATTVAGVGADTEVGVTLYNLQWERQNGEFGYASNDNEREGPLAPLLLANTQTIFFAERPVQLSLGGQAGVNLARADQLAFAARAYLLLVVDLEERGRCTAGPYVASRTMLGGDQNFGGFLGCEIEVIQRRFGLEAEWDLGANALGKLSLGPRVHLGHWGALALGVQIPNGWGEAEWRGIMQLEVTYPGAQE